MSRVIAVCAAVVALAVGVALGPATARPAGARSANFIADCDYYGPVRAAYYYRYWAMLYAIVGAYEGYQWGGGCWNNNNIDDSPGDPPGDATTGGEGGDCSGFVFKTWHESTSTADAGFSYWRRVTNIHGPYTAYSFMIGAGAPNIRYPKAYAIPMDAFASSYHIGMLFSPNSDGTDQIVEAKGEAYGTSIWTRTYRGSTSYGGTRRLGWTG